MSETSGPFAYVCAFSEDDVGGIFCYRQDETDGSLRYVDRTPAPSVYFAAVHPEGTHLYVVDRVDDGHVLSYELDAESGELTKLNQRSSGGNGPCYVSIDRTGSYAFVANYRGGTVSMLPIDDGRLGEATDVVEHEGSSRIRENPEDSPSQAVRELGINTERYGDPHPHCIYLDPTDSFAYVPDFGTDRIVVYRIDFERGALAPVTPPYAAVHEGAGPRHVVVHPNGQYAYVINELDSTISTLAIEAESGCLDEIQTVATVPESYGEPSFAADVHVHPSGNWLYGSNRGHDSISVFDVDRSTGRLRRTGTESTRGHWPRHFTLDPAGRYLYAENRRSDSIVTFEIGPSGQLSPVHRVEDVPEPVCFQFVEGP